ncbi:hypothetical protein B0H16DRAFT_1265442, partial [Mycena metata]
WFALEKDQSDSPEALYYPRVFVWVPSKLLPNDFSFTCIFCGKGEMRESDWNSNPNARRVVDLDSCYYILSKRVKCRNSCHKSCTMYHDKILQQLPPGLRNQFPAFLTHRSGIDKNVMTLVRSTIAHGLTPNLWEHIFRELHVFGSLWTLINQFEQIRQMILTPTRHLHHVEGPLCSVVKSLHEYGHAPISLLWTDNVRADRQFVERVIPTLRVNV